MMTEEVMNTDGSAVHVLDVSDLNRAQAKVIGWVVGVGIFVAFSVGVWVNKLQAKNDAQDLLLTRSEEHIRWAEGATRQMDSLRIEMRHMTEVTTELSTTVKELSALVARRGVR